jgi:hypothetical protein
MAIGRLTSVADVAADAAHMLTAGESLKDVWRFCLLQLLDDYESVLRHEGVDAAALLWRDAPTFTGDARVDAAFAALAEHLARRERWSTPAWALDPEREAREWWFVTDLRGLHPRALVESPLSFRKRGVFITDGALTRV